MLGRFSRGRRAAQKLPSHSSLIIRRLTLAFTRPRSPPLGLAYIELKSHALTNADCDSTGRARTRSHARVRVRTPIFDACQRHVHVGVGVTAASLDFVPQLAEPNFQASTVNSKSQTRVNQRLSPPLHPSPFHSALTFTFQGSRSFALRSSSPSTSKVAAFAHPGLRAAP